MQAVENKTSVLNLVFKAFTNINSTTDFCTLCKSVSRFSVENFLSQSAKKFRRGTLLFFRKFLITKNDRDERGRVSRFSVKIVLSGSTESFRRGTLLCFRKLRVSKSFMPTKGTSRFSMKICCLTKPRNFVGEPFCFCFTKFPVSKKFMDKRGGGVSRFSVEIFFCLTVPNYFVGEPFSVSLISGIEKVYVEEGYVTFILSFN